MLNFALPRLHLWNGAKFFHNKNLKRANVEWEKCLNLAREAKMVYEEALSTYTIGVLTKNPGKILITSRNFLIFPSRKYKDCLQISSRSEEPFC
jgi:hypothetical protein